MGSLSPGILEQGDPGQGSSTNIGLADSGWNGLTSRVSCDSEIL